MAYQTGSATSQNDLLQQLAAWLVTQGWALDASQADGAGWRAHLHKSGHYLHLKTLPTGSPFNGQVAVGQIPGLYCYMSSSFAGVGQNWYANLAGAPLGTDGRVCGVGIVVAAGANTSFHFFNDGEDNYTIVVERSAGLFQVMGFGMSLIRHGGDWPGGAFLHGQMSGAHALSTSTVAGSNSLCPFHYGTAESTAANGALVRIDIDGFTGNWVAIGPMVNATGNYPRANWTGKQGFSTVYRANTLPASIPHTNALVAYLTSSVNSQAVLLPVRIYVLLNEGGPCLIGTAPSVWQSNAVGNGFLAGAEISLGPDTYKLFPEFAVRKVV